MPPNLRVLFRSWRKVISNPTISNPRASAQGEDSGAAGGFSRLLTDQLLFRVNKPGQYLGNEWGAVRKEFASADVHVCLAFPDIYELGMSNFGQRILYQIVNSQSELLCDRTYAPGSDLEKIMRDEQIPLWGWETRHPLNEFEMLGFSLAYELTYTNVLNMLELAHVPVRAEERTSIFPLVFGGGPSTVNPEPMAFCMDFFIIGDGEQAIPDVMHRIRLFKTKHADELGKNESLSAAEVKELRAELLLDLAANVAGVYVPALYEVPQHTVEDLYPTDTVLKRIAELAAQKDAELHGGGDAAGPSGGSDAPSGSLEAPNTAKPNDANLLKIFQPAAKPKVAGIPERTARQIAPLNDDNQPTQGLVPYLSLVHDRQVLEVRRGCDRGCRFCQPGYTFLPVRERSAEDLVRLSKDALDKSGYQEYSLLSLCVSDYTSLYESVRALNREHTSRRASMSFPSQRADRMNVDIADELKAVRKSGITLAPEAGTERMRLVINKGLRHEQIINAIDSAYRSGWSSIKLYYMMGLPTERDEDLQGIIDTLKEATKICRNIRNENPQQHRRDVEFTCTISSFVPKPHTPFQWFGQCRPQEFTRKQQVMRDMLFYSKLRNVKLNFTSTPTSMLEAVISRGDRRVGEIVYLAWKKGCTFDAWDDRLQPHLWHEAANELGFSLEDLACTHRPVGSEQPWDVVNVGLAGWWLATEWKKAIETQETANCTENTCHACGICTDLDTEHVLANPSETVLGKNPFVKKLDKPEPKLAEETHPSLEYQAPATPPPNQSVVRIIFEFQKKGELKFISHLDLQHLIVRAARRANVFVAYSEGFNPSPRLSLALSLALYSEGLSEVGEIELSEDIAAEDFVRRINAQLPPEVQILRARTIEKTNTAAAQLVGKATYRAVPYSPEQVVVPAATDIQAKVSDLLARSSLEVEQTSRPKARRKGNCKKGQPERTEPSKRDIRPGIYRLHVVDPNSMTVEMELAHGPRLHVNPSHVLGCLAEGLDWRITRVDLKTENGTPLFDAL